MKPAWLLVLLLFTACKPSEAPKPVKTASQPVVAKTMKKEASNEKLTGLDRWISDSEELPGSRSPDGQFCVRRIHPEQSTASVFALCTVVSPHALSRLEFSVAEIPGKPGQLTVQFLWAQDSKTLAWHDPAAKHSRLHLVSLEGSSSIPIDPTSAEFFLRSQKLLDGSLKSSGEEPIKWLDASTLLVTWRGSALNGKATTFKLLLQIPQATWSLRP
jgi:hypothetical protein